MDNSVEIINNQAKCTIQITANIPMWKMPVVIGNAYKDITKYMDKNAAKPSGPPFVRYLNVKWNEINRVNKVTAFIKMFTRKWNMIIGFPIDKKLDGEKDLKPGELPGGKFVKTIHRGAYQKVGITYNKLLSFIVKENLNYKNESLEIYLNDPETTKEEDLETIVLIPISEKKV